MTQDLRPREERSLRELYNNEFSLHAPISLMNVPLPQVETDSSDDSGYVDHKKAHRRRAMISTGTDDDADADEGKRRKTKFGTVDSLSPVGKKHHVALMPSTDLKSVLPGAIKRIERARDKFLPCTSFKVSLPVNKLLKAKSMPTKMRKASAMALKPEPAKSISSKSPYISDVQLRQEDYMKMLEYDMDSIDRNFLRLQREKLFKLDDLVFEFVLDRFEKLWNLLILPIASKELTSLLPDDMTECSICGSGEACNSDVILLCDRCDLAVHQECYGIPNVPEGKWLCLKCAWAPNEPLECEVCPFRSEGAFKMTEEGRWCHSVCERWIDELSVSNDTYLEPITGISLIPPSRFKLTCRLCKVKRGAPIQCSNRQCGWAYHPLCMIKARLSFDFKAKKSYCPKHGCTGRLSGRNSLRGIKWHGDEFRVDHKYFLPAYMKSPSAIEHGDLSKAYKSVTSLASVGSRRPNKAASGNLKSKHFINIEDSDVDDFHECENDNNPLGFNATGLTNLSGMSGKVSQMTPIVPEVLLLKLRDYSMDDIKDPETEGQSKGTEASPALLEALSLWTSKYSASEREQILISLAQYWSLKREFKGAPLIRRLQMEPVDNLPYVSDLTSLDSETALLEKTHQEGLSIRKNLEHLRNLLDLYKTVIVTHAKSLSLSARLYCLWKFPLYYEMQMIHRDLERFDSKKKDIFKYPVNRDLVPDYYDVVKEPMSLLTMKEKLEKFEYLNIDAFEKDFELIVKNAKLYNKPSTIFYKHAERFEDYGRPLIYKAKKVLAMRRIDTLDESMDLLPSPLKDLLQGKYDADELSILHFFKAFPASLEFPEF